MVFPSLYEGFRLLILEAMACPDVLWAVGCQQLSLRAVVTLGILFDSLSNADEITAAMEQLLVNQEEAQDRAREGLEQSKSFNWASVAEEALGAMQGEYGKFS